MNQFSFTIYKQSRLLFGLFLSPIIIFASVFVGINLNSIIIPIILLIIAFFLIYYYAVGNITIIFKDEFLIFSWKRKIIFNYKEIKSIKLENIKTIVIDEGKLLKKIKTSEAVIYINNPKVNSSEAYNFILQLRLMTKQYNPKIIDSWDDFAEKGYLRFAYKLNTIILVISILLVLLFIILKGFKSHFLFVLLLFIPQMLLYRQQMKDKINKNK